jgi:hypothetical protein
MFEPPFYMEGPTDGCERAGAPAQAGMAPVGI